MDANFLYGKHSQNKFYMNGLIINDELHELVSLKNGIPCDNCSLQENCEKVDFFLCTITAGRYKSDERFVKRGKVKEVIKKDNSKYK